MRTETFLFHLLRLISPALSTVLSMNIWWMNKWWNWAGVPYHSQCQIIYTTVLHRKEYRTVQTMNTGLIYQLPWATMGFSGGSDGKESTPKAGDLGSIPGSGRSPGEGNGNLPVFLHGELHGQRSLAGCRPWGQLDMTEWITHHIGSWPHGNVWDCSKRIRGVRHTPRTHA